MPKILALALLLLVAAAGPDQAAEPSRQFLESLRQRGYFDEALAYLDEMRTSPLVPPGFRDTIDYEQAVTLLDSLRSLRAAADCEKRLAAAKARLTAFLAEHPQHALASRGRERLADLLVRQGRLDLDEAARAGPGTDEGKQRRAAARQAFQEAQEVFVDARRRAEETIKKLGFVDPKDLRKSAARDQANRQQLQARLSGGWLLYEIAQTTALGSHAQRTILAEAAKRFGDLYEKYGDCLAGLYARMGQGRCYQDLGEPRRAFSIFEELLALPDQPAEFRTLKSKAAVEALQTALWPGVKKYKEAVDIAEQWIEEEPAAGPPGEEGLAIRYLGGEAALAYAAALGPGAEQAKLRQKYAELARKYFTVVADGAGPYQAKAKVRLLDPALATPGSARKPATFADARDLARAALDRLAEAEQKAAGLHTVAHGGANRLDIEAARNEALQYCRLALELGGKGAPAADLDAVCYYTAYLQFKSGDLQQAAKLGERLARRPDQSPAAREGAKIALAAYDAMFRDADSDADERRSGERLVDVAREIAKRWGDQPEADEARLVLLQAAVRGGQLPAARQYLDQIPLSSSRRGAAELTLGQAIAAAYLRAARLPQAQRPPESELEKTAAQAQQVLRMGVERMRKSVEAGGPVPSLLAAAVLSLAQICLSAGSAEEALAWLADPKIGAKTLVDAGDPVADEDDFALETYQAALSAYVAGRQIEKAQHAMQTMEELVQQSGQPDANQRLVQVYIRLGRELECQVGRLRGQGRSERLAKLVAAFEAFAAQTARPREGSGFFALDAAAEMRLGIAAGLDAWGLPPPEEARKYYRRAAAAYRGLLERCRADGSFTPRPEAVTAATIRLARCLRRLGEGREALDLLAPILRKHKALVDAQVEAAYTYQDWARQKPECYQSAVEGSPEHPEVWGWQELCRRLESSAKYQDTFYEARYNLGLCRFEQAQAQADGQRQAELLEAAARELRDAKQLSTKPGGSAWHDQYDDLLRRIQKRGNQTPAGRPTPADKN